MLRLAYCALLGVLLIGAPTQAAEQAASRQQMASTKPNDPNEILCKRVPPKIGTRLGGGKFCMTRRAWDQEEALSRELKDDAQRRARLGPVGWW